MFYINIKFKHKINLVVAINIDNKDILIYVGKIYILPTNKKNGSILFSNNIFFK